jgi:murein DD-endopeptidase MepM/ murein hydrolase activator NlpD
MRTVRVGLLFAALFVSVFLPSLVRATDGPAILPLFGKHSRCFGQCGYLFTEDAHYDNIGWVKHPGWDFNLDPDDANAYVYAIADGTVRDAAPFEPATPTTWGSVVIEHSVSGQTFYSQYGHCQKVFVKVGQAVRKGNLIARVGAVGATDADGPHYHLHWEIRGANHPAATTRSFFGNSTYPISVLANVQSWYRDPEPFVAGLDITAEYLDMGSSNFGSQQNNVHWYTTLDGDHPYRTTYNNLAATCYIQNWSGGTFGLCGVVFDPLCGARRAYTIHNGFYHDGGGGQGWNDIGGPISNLGMPITDEYAYQGGIRQDFQARYLRYQQGHSPEVWSTTYTAPGWTSSGWNPSYSYLFAAAYERNGGAVTVGNASGNVFDYGPYKRQDFTGGSFGNCCILYDPDDGVLNKAIHLGNPASTNQAYLLRTGFYGYYFAHGGYSAFGCPTTDEYPVGTAGDAWQFFDRRPSGLNGETQQHHMYYHPAQPYLCPEGPVCWHSTYTTAYSTQTPAGQFNMARGATRQFTVKFTNTGQFTWHNDANAYPYDYVQLKSCDQSGVVCNSFLNDPLGSALNWIDAQTPCTMVESSVDPGHTATFTFTGKVDPSAPLGLKGVYFRPEHSVAGLMDDWGDMYFQVNVVAAPAVHPRLDYDGDGKSDIVFLDKRDTGYLRVDYAANGFWPLDASYPNYGTAAGIWNCPGDFNGDHVTDFAQINPAYSNGMFQINYGPVLVDGFTSNFDNYGTGTLIPVVADFNGDGYDDYSQFEPASGYWRVNYGPDFASGFELMLPYYGNWGFSPCAGDFDGDGKADLLMMDRWHGVVYINYASNGFTSGYDNLPGYPNYGVSDSIIPLAGDVNGDGYCDYLQYETDTGYLRINYGPNIANGFEAHLPGYPTGANIYPWVGDFDGDGKTDLLVYMQSTWTIGIDYANNGLGALEFFRTYFNPDGSSAKFTPPDEDQPPQKLAFSLTTVPNPTRSTVGINFTLPVADRVSLSICDVSGREVTRFAEELYGVGPHTLSWNRTSPRGGRVANGVYFLTFKSTLHTVSKKIVVLN